MQICCMWLVKMNKFVFVAIPVILVLLSCLLQVIIIDRTFWTDESFTQLTIEKNLNIQQFREYDVHPPGYYKVLGLWEMFNPLNIVEHMWLRLFSTVCAALFILVVMLMLEKLFGLNWKMFVVGVLISLSTTIAYFGSEARSYILVMLLSALAVYFVLDDKLLIIPVSIT